MAVGQNTKTTERARDTFIEIAPVIMSNPASLTNSIAKLSAVMHGTPVQLEIWPERLRALPNTLARGALFTASGKKEPRDQYKRQQIVSLAGSEISYTGEELRQDDQDVWLQFVHIARLRPLGNGIEATGHALLQGLQWGASKLDYIRLRASIVRMTEGTVWVTAGGCNPWSGRLLVGTAHQGGDGSTNGAWSVGLDPKIVKLFAPDGISLLDWDSRLLLKPLAKWLHSFYSTHRQPYAYTVSVIHQLCGSKTTRLANFRSGLKASFDELIEVGFLDCWSHEPISDTVNVIRRAQVKSLSDHHLP